MVDAGMIIVGAGEAGARAAFGLREKGYGGPVTLIGAEPHLPYERPPLSKEALASEGPIIKPLADVGRFAQLDIELIVSDPTVRVEPAARMIVLEGGTCLSYDRLLLATGARPRALALAEGSRRCMYLRTNEDAEAIRGHLQRDARIAVIGGGFIGLELAAAARNRGCRVCVLEAEKRLLTRAVPAEIAAMVRHVHARNGVDIRCEASVTALAETAESIVLSLADGTTINADCCIVGIGAVANAELAAQAGLEIDNGIRVDACLKTSDPHIFAAGDCCSFPVAAYGGRRVRLESWRNARDQGEHAAGSMLGSNEDFRTLPWFWSDQFALTLQIAGLVDEARLTVRREIGDGAFILFHLADDGRLVAASGIGGGNAVARDIRMAEMMIDRGICPPREMLADPGTKLKQLLATQEERA